MLFCVNLKPAPNPIKICLFRCLLSDVRVKHVFCFLQALIDELFHPSSTTTTTTTTPATTSTQRLPIKAHELGWDLSPIDLVMANSVLEPVFSDDQKQVSIKSRVYTVLSSLLKKDK